MLNDNSSYFTLWPFSVMKLSSPAYSHWLGLGAIKKVAAIVVCCFFVPGPTVKAQQYSALRVVKGLVV